MRARWNRAASILIAVPATATFVTLSVAVLMGRALVEATRRALLARARRSQRTRFA
jgi:hypothetical protein